MPIQFKFKQLDSLNDNYYISKSESLKMLQALEDINNSCNFNDPNFDLNIFNSKLQNFIEHWKNNKQFIKNEDINQQQQKLQVTINQMISRLQNVSNNANAQVKQQCDYVINLLNNIINEFNTITDVNNNSLTSNDTHTNIKNIINKLADTTDLLEFENIEQQLVQMLNSQTNMRKEHGTIIINSIIRTPDIINNVISVISKLITEARAKGALSQDTYMQDQLKEGTYKSKIINVLNTAFKSHIANRIINRDYKIFEVLFFKNSISDELLNQLYMAFSHLNTNIEINNWYDKNCELTGLHTDPLYSKKNLVQCIVQCIRTHLRDAKELQQKQKEQEIMSTGLNKEVVDPLSFQNVFPGTNIKALRSANEALSSYNPPPDKYIIINDQFMYINRSFDSIKSEIEQNDRITNITQGVIYRSKPRISVTIESRTDINKPNDLNKNKTPNIPIISYTAFKYSLNILEDIRKKYTFDYKDNNDTYQYPQEYQEAYQEQFNRFKTQFILKDLYYHFDKYNKQIELFLSNYNNKDTIPCNVNLFREVITEIAFDHIDKLVKLYIDNLIYTIHKENNITNSIYLDIFNQFLSTIDNIDNIESLFYILKDNIKNIHKPNKKVVLDNFIRFCSNYFIDYIRDFSKEISEYFNTFDDDTIEDSISDKVIRNIPYDIKQQVNREIAQFNKEKNDNYSLAQNNFNQKLDQAYFDFEQFIKQFNDEFSALRSLLNEFKNDPNTKNINIKQMMIINQIKEIKNIFKKQTGNKFIFKKISTIQLLIQSIINSTIELYKLYDKNNAKSNKKNKLISTNYDDLIKLIRSQRSLEDARILVQLEAPFTGKYLQSIAYKKEN